MIMGLCPATAGCWLATAAEACTDTQHRLSGMFEEVRAPVGSQRYGVHVKVGERYDMQVPPHAQSQDQ